MSHEPTPAEGAARAMRAALAAAAAASILLFLATAALRLNYPYKLEWMEDLTLAHVERASRGEPLYIEPSAEFTPSFYTPLSYYAAVPAVRLGGARLPPLRAFSLACSLAALLGLFMWARRETGDWLYGLVAAGFAAAAYKLGGAFLDLARVDAVFLPLIVFAAYALRFHARPNKPWTWAWAGLALALAYFSKQTALIMSPPLVLYAASVSPRRAALPFAAAFALGVALPSLALQFASGGWYGYYVWGLLFGQPINAEQIWKFWIADIGAAVPIAFAFGLFAAFRFWRAGDRPRLIFYLCAGASFLGGAWAARLNVGGYKNVLIPAHMFLGVAFAIGLERAMDPAAGSRPRRARWLSSAAPWLASLQLILMWYDPSPLIPTAADRAAGDRVVEAIAKIPGDVYVPFNPLYATMAGKRRFSHALPILDVIRADRGPTGKLARSLLEGPLARREFGAVVLDNKDWLLVKPVQREYPLASPLPVDDALWPPTGWRTRPETIHLPPK